MSAPVQLALLALVEDAILPGEERSIGAPSIDGASLKAARALVGKALCLVTVAHAAELPSLVKGRWATQCTVIAVEDGTLTVRGERRVKLVNATGLSAPFTAEVDPAPPPNADGTTVNDLLDGAHAVLAALHAGAVPRAPGWRKDFSASLSAMLRALCATEELIEVQQFPLPEALQHLARSLARRTEGERASARLEEMARQLAAAGKGLPKDLRQRLWDQCVEILRRLDVYDTTTGSDEDDIARLQKRLQQAGLPRDARELAKRELRLMRSMETRHHDFPTYRGHLDFMARLPWHPETMPPPELDKVTAALDREHSGLQKPKERILEYLAVRTLGGSARSTILCLAGPPGVGKTTIARAIAEALGRKFVRVALGGVHDETEIRGHRLSYVAASPGRILQGLAMCGSCAPVMLLDEIDKVGTERARSPIGALHEVLDPEQNTHFHDNYLGVPFDLSHVLFICTANDVSLMHPTLRDRLEVVELEGYLAGEKVGIARGHLMSRLAKESGLPAALEVAPDALELIIESHTRESGVRELRRKLEAIHRRRALQRVRGGSAEGPITVTEVQEVLGPPRYLKQARLETLPPGVALGLSVGVDGGSVIHVETGLLPGRGELRLTGRLGEVMRESAQMALACLRMDAAAYGVERGALEGDAHVHVPEAAVPKDGPSAGIALFSAFLSCASKRAIAADVAMTGELTLSGQVLPVGGVRAKVLAAERAGARVVILPRANAADVPTETKVRVELVGSAREVVALLWGDAA